MAMHVLARVNTDPADGRTLNVDAKFHFRLFGCRSLQEFVRVLDRVWMREKIAYPQPDFAIVRMCGYGFGIIQSPRANGALLKRKLHVFTVYSISVCALGKHGGRSYATPCTCATIRRAARARGARLSIC